MNKTQHLPLVFLHGFLCDPRLWQDVQSQLDYPGAVHLIDFKHCKSLEDMLGQIEQIKEPRFHLIGFSMGGYIAEVFALKYPEKIESLTLVAANVGALSEREQASRMKMADMLSRVQYKGISEKEVTKFIHPSSAQNPHIVKTIMAMSAAYTSEMYVNQMRATLQREDLTESLDGQDFPILIIAGREDKVVSLASLEAFRAGIARSEFQVLSESGHYVPLEKSAELAEILKNKFSPKI